VFVHVLTGEREVANPELPGPAGAVRAVPFENEPLAALSAAGFVGARLLKFDAKPCFVRGGVGMRETQLEAFAPPAESGDTVEVMYRGPFAELRDDAGRVFARGARVSVPVSVAEVLRGPELAALFTVFPPVAARPLTVTACAG
jgi:hypothetical protein